MLNVVSTSEMKEFDNFTMQTVDSLVLMKRASNFLLDNIDKTLPTAIVVGSGNNGGDGLSLAEDLFKFNKNIVVVKLAEPKTDSSKYYLKKVLDLGVKIVDYSSEFKLENYDQIIDCIFGVGLDRDVTGIYKEAILRINNLNKVVVSADIPSGLNGNNGKTKLAVKATKTVTFGAIKLGHLLAQGKDYTGELFACDIGINCDNSKCKIYQKRDFIFHFKQLKQDLHKYSNGKVVLIGGSKNFVGAPILSNMAVASLRVGAGLSTIVVPECIRLAVSSRVLESTLQIAQDNGEHMLFTKDIFDRAILKAKAVAIGMGIGVSNSVLDILKYLLGQDIKLIIDADAITVLSQNMHLLIDKKAQVILTPHIMEFSRLTNLSIEEISENPVEIVENFAKKYGVTVLLKGATTIISDGTKIALSPYGNSSLAKGGSGDVLSGIILGLLAKNSIYDSAVIGSYILGRSAELLQEELTCYSVIASDVVNKIPYVIKEIMQEN